VSAAVLVTGIGAVTGFGPGAERLWQALLAGARALRKRAPLVSGGGHPLAVGPLALVDEVAASAPSRAQQMALLAAHEALDDAGLSQGGARLAVACGTTLGGIGNWLPIVRSDERAAMVKPLLLDEPAVAAPARWGYAGPAQAVAAAVDARGPLIVPSVACASGNVALGAALDLLRSGGADVALAGGVDALHDFVIAGFATLKALDPEACRPFDRARRGLNLGEAACFLVLESPEHARRRGARVRACLDGYGVAADAVHMTGPDREGRGAARAMAAALADAKRTAADVDFVSAHGTATQFNDLMESKALALVLGDRAPHTPLNSIKSALGHTLGAAAALEALLCVRIVETGIAPATPGLEEIDPDIQLDVIRGTPRRLDARTTLSTASGFGGTNAAVVITRA
jgi:3-oxoacyl-[acyl-carrier-protein] synthase II